MPGPAAHRGFPTRLDLLCACLIAGLGGRRLDDETASLLSAPAMDHGRLARLAGRHLVTPMLAGCFGEAGLRERLPADFVRYVTLMHERNQRRNIALRRQIREAAAALNAIGVEPVPLKGAIRLVDDLYPDIGWRFMRDLDFLIARERLDEALACLQREGYRLPAGASDHDDRHHLPPLHRDGEEAVIELHTDLLSENRQLCPADGVLARSIGVELDGAAVRLPDAADQLGHLIGHDLNDGFLRRSSMFRLRSTLEAALLCRDGGVPEQVLARCEGRALTSGVRTALGLAARYFPGLAPSLADSGASLRRRARWLGALERLDESGRLRRFLWFARLRIAKLLKQPDERRHLAAHMLSPGYHQRCVRRLRRLWASD